MKHNLQYNTKSKQPKLKIDDQVMVHFLHTVKGKAWKLAHLYFGLYYKIISLTWTIAKVQRVDQLSGEILLVALDWVHPCWMYSGLDTESKIACARSVPWVQVIATLSARPTPCPTVTHTHSWRLQDTLISQLYITRGHRSCKYATSKHTINHSAYRDPICVALTTVLIQCSTRRQ